MFYRSCFSTGLYSSAFTLRDIGSRYRVVPYRWRAVSQLVEALYYNPKYPCSIPDEVSDFVLNFPNASSHTVVLVLTHPLTEMSTRIPSEG
jgi:hypothetical protein